MFTYVPDVFFRKCQFALMKSIVKSNFCELSFNIVSEIFDVYFYVPIEIFFNSRLSTKYRHNITQW